MLRFHNVRTGYVRSYRIVTAENKTDGVSSRLNACPQYDREYTSHVLERSDSTGSSGNKELSFGVATANKAWSKATFRIGATTVELALQEVEEGAQALVPATFAGRSHPGFWAALPASPFPGAWWSRGRRYSRSDVR